VSTPHELGSPGRTRKARVRHLGRERAPEPTLIAERWLLSVCYSKAKYRQKLPPTDVGVRRRQLVRDIGSELEVASSRAM